MVDELRPKNNLVHGDSNSDTSSSSTSEDHASKGPTDKSRHRRRRRRRRSGQDDDTGIHMTPHEATHRSETRRPSLRSPKSTDSRERSADLRQTRIANESETPRRTRSVRSPTSIPRRKDSRDSTGRDIDNDQHERHSRRRSSASVRERHSRPGLTRHSTSARQTVTATPLPTVKEESRSKTRAAPQRTYSVWGNLFGPPRPAEPEVKVSCLTCLDDVPASKAPELPCGHHMCADCLKRVFTLSVTDPAHMPPKCCTEDVIPLKHVTKIFDDRFKMRWNRKYQEYTTKNRIYCVKKGCGSWIPPSEISRDKDGRKYGTCRRCKTQVCALCNGKKHKSKECPKDDETRDFAQIAKQNGWQQCYNCSATVELKEGCNHMTCRCTAQFCMICGLKWKTCNCPWFNYTTVNQDNLNHMNIPQVREEVARGGGAFAQPRAYQEEIDQRRRQEQQDEELARRVQATDFLFRGTAAWATFGFGRMDANTNANMQQALPPMNLENGLPVRRVFVGDPRNPFNVLPVQVDPPRPNFMPAPPRHHPGAFQQPAQERVPDRAPSETVPGRDSAQDTRPPLRRGAAVRSNNRQNHTNQNTPTETLRVPANIGRNEESDVNAGVPNEQANREERRRSALLAGLNRNTDTGRVDAWRRHVSGEPVMSPLF